MGGILLVVRSSRSCRWSRKYGGEGFGRSYLPRRLTRSDPQGDKGALGIRRVQPGDRAVHEGKRMEHRDPTYLIRTRKRAEVQTHPRPKRLFISPSLPLALEFPSTIRGIAH